jgi:hypothetical protein
MITLTFAILGILSSIIGLRFYLGKMKQSNTPKKPIGLIISMLLGLSLAGYAVSLSSSTAETILAGTLFGFTVFIAVMLSFLLLQKKAPLGDIKVKMGDFIIPLKGILLVQKHLKEKEHYLNSLEVRGAHTAALS